MNLSVTYERRGESVKSLLSRLYALGDRAFAEGLFTGDGPAEVTGWSHAASVSAGPPGVPEYESWGQDPEFDRAQWKAWVVADDTLLGYWDWVAEQRVKAESGK